MPQKLAVNRMVLLPAPSPADAPIRRYRLARLQLDTRTPGDRFGHLKRAHD